MSLINLLLGFAVNLAVALVIVRAIYYPMRRDRSQVFTFLAFNTVVYFVMTFLGSAELSVGVGFGLFAIFSVLRYRTSEISTREMTYLFILIALPVMNSVLINNEDWMALLVANLVITAILYVLEQGWGFRGEEVKFVRYERIDLIRPEQRPVLLEDLRQRTGLPVTRVEIGRINFVDDSVEMWIYHDEVDRAHAPSAPVNTAARTPRILM